MDDRPLATLKTILMARGLKGEFETLGNPMDETRMYIFNGVLVIFSDKTRVTERELNNFLSFATENNHTSGIIVISMSKPSDSVLRVVREHISNKDNSILQIFDIRHLNIDISKHRKVSPHRIITADETEKMMKEFNIDKPRNILPWIDSQDPMAKWIGARPDDIIEVLRISESAGHERVYRYCVANATDD